MRVVLDSFLAKVAYKDPTSAGNFVAAVTLDKTFLASRALANQGGRNRFLNRQTSLGHFFLFDLVAARTLLDGRPE